MSHSPPVWLTVLLSLLFPATVFAQGNFNNTEFKQHLAQLASPVAVERARAVADIAAMEGEIATEMRLAWPTSSTMQRFGLLKAAGQRQDAALLQHAAEGLTDADERLKLGARLYMDQLPYAELRPDTDKWAGDTIASWDEYLQQRMRREIAAALLDAHLKPGKFDGQFDALRLRGSEVVDAHLLSLFAMEAVWVDVLNEGVRRRIEQGVEAERMNSSLWSQLVRSNDGFGAATTYLRTMDFSTEVATAVKHLRRGQFIAALEVSNHLRSAAIRALAESEHGAVHVHPLQGAYLALALFAPAPDFAVASDVSLVRMEIEITLARFGQPELLDARIANLRGQIAAMQEAGGNVAARPAARPDLLAGNEIAHLLLRRGDYEGAEKQWKAMVDDAMSQVARADNRGRVSLSSYLASVYYNLACAQALQLKLSLGHESLRKAVHYGYKDFQWMLEDGDLRPLRDFDAFRDWFAEVAPPYIADQLRHAAHMQR